MIVEIIDEQNFNDWNLTVVLILLGSFSSSPLETKSTEEKRPIML